MIHADSRDTILSSVAASHPEFAEASSRLETSLLDLAALVAEGLGPVDLVRLNNQVAFLAYLVDKEAKEAASVADRLEAMRQVLAEEEGLRGDQETYHDPDNSFICHVIDHGQGLPISLSVIYLAVAERLRWPLVGVDFPGHFLCRWLGTDDILLVDPFHDGQVVTSLNVCARLAGPSFQHVAGRARDDLVRRALDIQAPPRRIVQRMLRNLELLYLRQRDYPEARNIIEKRLLLAPDGAAELRDLGGIYHLTGEHRLALACYQSYLHDRPRASDRAEVEAVTQRLRELLDED